MGRHIVKYKYITLQEIEKQKGRKTVDYIIVSNSSDTILGWVNYHNHWRQHVFTPASETIWNKDCLDNISEFLGNL